MLIILNVAFPEKKVVRKTSRKSWCWVLWKVSLNLENLHISLMIFREESERKVFGISRYISRYIWSQYYYVIIGLGFVITAFDSSTLLVRVIAAPTTAPIDISFGVPPVKSKKLKSIEKRGCSHSFDKNCKLLLHNFWKSKKSCWANWYFNN